MTTPVSIRFEKAELEQFKVMLERHRSVSVLSHIRPDADALGTSLGIFHLLRRAGYRVEVANATEELPLYLDFLKGFGSVKKRMDFSDSLVIACDCGSPDRLGFGMEGRTVVNLDHHRSNTAYGDLNLVRDDAVSSSEVAFRFFSSLFGIPKESSEAFYAALISDTRYFTTRNVTAETFEVARELIDLGAEPARIAQAMIRRHSLASLRILGKALESLKLFMDAQVAVLTVRLDEMEKTGARGSDLEGIVDYARSLVTVELAVLLVERRDGIKVSLRSKTMDLIPLAAAFGGGGHREAAGFERKGESLDGVCRMLLQWIREEGVLKRP